MEDFDDIERQIRTIIAEELQADEKRSARTRRSQSSEGIHSRP